MYSLFVQARESGTVKRELSCSYWSVVISLTSRSETSSLPSCLVSNENGRLAVFGRSISYISPQGMNFFLNTHNRKSDGERNVGVYSKIFPSFQPQYNLVNLKMKKAFICQFTA